MSIAEKLISLRGKTVEAVCATADARDGENPFESLTLFFTDGTEMHLHSYITLHGSEEHQSESAIEVEFK
jgi:hypothetical protein